MTSYDQFGNPTMQDLIWLKGQVMNSLDQLGKATKSDLIQPNPVRSPDLTQPILTKSDLRGFVKLRLVWDQLGNST